MQQQWGMSGEMMRYNSKKLRGNKLIQTNGMRKIRAVWNGIDNDNNRNKMSFMIKELTLSWHGLVAN